MREFKVICDYCGAKTDLLSKTIHGEPDVLVSPEGWLVMAKEFSEDALDIHACPKCLPKPKKKKKGIR